MNAIFLLGQPVIPVMAKRTGAWVLNSQSCKPIITNHELTKRSVCKHISSINSTLGQYQYHLKMV